MTVLLLIFHEICWLLNLYIICASNKYHYCLILFIIRFNHLDKFNNKQNNDILQIRSISDVHRYCLPYELSLCVVSLFHPRLSSGVKCLCVWRVCSTIRKCVVWVPHVEQCGCVSFCQIPFPQWRIEMSFLSRSLYYVYHLTTLACAAYTNYYEWIEFDNMCEIARSQLCQYGKHIEMSVNTLFILRLRTTWAKLKLKFSFCLFFLIRYGQEYTYGPLHPFQAW